jgi:hypothetical protein
LLLEGRGHKVAKRIHSHDLFWVKPAWEWPDLKATKNQMRAVTRWKLEQVYLERWLS